MQQRSACTLYSVSDGCLNENGNPAVERVDVNCCVACRPTHPLIRRVTDWDDVEEALAVVAQQC